MVRVVNNIFRGGERMYNLIIDKEEAKKILSERLQKAKKSYIIETGLKYTFRELSSKIGISSAHIEGVVNGRQLSSLEKLVKLAIAFNADPFELVDGLQLHIKPIGFKISNWDLDEREEYNKILQAMVDSSTRDLGEGHIDGYTYYNHPDDYVAIIDDNAMVMDGIPKGSRIYWSRSYKEIVNGKLYFIKFKGKNIVRRLWRVGEKVVLVPSIFKSGYKIEETDAFQVEERGVPYRVQVDFKKGSTPTKSNKTFISSKTSK